MTLTADVYLFLSDDRFELLFVSILNNLGPTESGMERVKTEKLHCQSVLDLFELQIVVTKTNMWLKQLPNLTLDRSISRRYCSAA